MNMEKATLAGGCFWCTEAIFKRLKGVEDVIPGYAGGTRENPTYDQIHGGATGHAESIQITFDPKVISFEKLLKVFFKLHDPTTKDRQGNDVGPQYRSVIFCHDEKQKEIAEMLIKDLEDSGVYTEPIVTEVVPYTAFYPAEPEHREFYERNPNSPYCMFVIDPKITKLYKEFGEDTKKEEEI
ncbi:MAG: peptide-methionine (S)-S-oxide reductase [Candidatus Levybacteria bacterium RIFCSPHIGHO2_01_FULL_38_26]|nr:MAG: peptide-methionine (S)-S-oxide reductase [Candidatus Levybacteria bacterium RIFCSPHIGHO2_01_FULL_38_26]